MQHSMDAGDNRIEKALVDNFIALQKVMANLSASFDNLSNKISKLLELFETSAKTLAQKDYGIEKNARSEKGVAERLDKLLDQNKIIAKGISMLHEETSGMGEETSQNAQQIPQRKIAEESDGYQKSISSKFPRP